MKKLLITILALALLLSASGQILRYGTYSVPIPPDPPTFPQIETGTTKATGEASGSLSHAITIPTGTVSGDLILVFFSLAECGDAITINTGISGNNWTIESQSLNANSTLRGAILWKIAEGSDALTVTSSGFVVSCYIAYRISDFNTSNPLTVTVDNTLEFATIDPPSNTGEYGTKKYLWIAAGATLNGTIATAAPTDFTDLITQTNGDACSVDSADREYEYGSAYNPGTFTGTTARPVCWTVIVNPVP